MSDYKYLILTEFYENMIDGDFIWPESYKSSSKKITYIDKMVKYFEKRDVSEDYDKCKSLTLLKQKIQSGV